MLLAGLLLVPLADQAVKLLLRRRLGPRALALGPLGELRTVTARIWLARGTGRPGLAGIWALWLLSAAAVALLGAGVPACAGFAGLLLGGSLSHAVESSVRGGVTDYVCLRFWPAFDLADVAITVGATGVVWRVVLTMTDLAS